MTKKNKYSVIDFFAGAGGLSTGFEQTGKFEVLAAVEYKKDMQTTYKKNHPDTEMLSDITDIDFVEMHREYGNVDVIIGGPPCQGFSNANRQRNHIINMNNLLTKSYIDAISEFKPEVFVLENVSMLASNKHMFFCENTNLDTIKSLEVTLHEKHIKIDIPSTLRDTVYTMLRDGNAFDEVCISEKHYVELNSIYKKRNDIEKFDNAIKNKFSEITNIVYEYKNTCTKTRNNLGEYLIKLSDELLNSLNKEENCLHSLASLIEMQRTISKLNELLNKDIFIKSTEKSNDGLTLTLLGYTVIDYINAVLTNDYNLKYSFLKAEDYGAPQRRKRFIMIGCLNKVSSIIEMPKPILDKDSYYTVEMAIADLSDIVPENNLKQYNPINREVQKKAKSTILYNYLCNSDIIYNHINTASRKKAKERFEQLKQGQNFHDLSNDYKSNYANTDRVQNSIYRRLKYDEPSGTVVNVRKSMWIHPEKDRAISIREAARLQTFPDNYIFTGTKDSQYQQVGNAVPPVLARAIAESVLKILNDVPIVQLKNIIIKEEE